MVQRSVVVLLLVMFVFVGCGGDEPKKVKPKEDTKEVVVANAQELVVANAQELKGIKATTIIWKKDGAKMVRIPEIFEIVVPSRTEPPVYDKFGDLVKAETVIPAKKVKVRDAFFMDATEVTVGLFKKFLKSSDYEPKEPIDWNKVYEYSPTGKHPMIYVSWHDATAYAKWAGKRLPTEKEWEFAARGGLVDKMFSWGDEESIAREYANSGGALGRDQWDETTAPVGSLKPNGYGLFDMSGNVWEWCGDWYDEDNRIVRGGSWNSISDFLRVAYRIVYHPSYTIGYSGFRCVMDVEE